MRKLIKSAYDGITNQKTLEDNFEVSIISVLSKYIQTTANTETKEIYAKILPIKELLLETSEIATISKADISTFIM